MVHLSLGNSFDDHCWKMGRNMNDHLRAILNHMYPKTVLCTCAGVADETSEDFRADPGVKEILFATKKLPEPEHLK
jgi:hypothetical protein